MEEGLNLTPWEVEAGSSLATSELETSLGCRRLCPYKHKQTDTGYDRQGQHGHLLWLWLQGEPGN